MPEDLDHPVLRRRRRRGSMVHLTGAAVAALSIAMLVIGSLSVEASPDDEGPPTDVTSASETPSPTVTPTTEEAAAAPAPTTASSTTVAPPTTDAASTTTPTSSTPTTIVPDTNEAGPPSTEVATTAPVPVDDAVVALDAPEERCAPSGGETVATDKADYPPESTVLVSGSGYGPGCRLRVEITRPDGSIVRGDGTFSPGVDEVVTSGAGTFSYAYQLDGIEGTYRIRVLGPDGLALATTTFTDQLPRAVPSDPRAIFVEGNVVTCAGVGAAGSIQVGSASNSNASDGNVAGTVAINTGPIQPGRGQELDVAILNPNPGVVVIDRVVVKGSNGFNIYADPAVLPPTLLPPQHYISPLTDGTNVPRISHWFVCYHLATPPPTGELVVDKIVIPPNGVPIDPLPVEFVAMVDCDNLPAPVEVTFGPGGGQGTPTIDNLPVGTVCTVVETTTGFPAGTIVTYDPPGLDTDGVTIPAGNVGVTVAIINDFADLPLQHAAVAVVKEVVLPVPPGVQLPSQYTVALECTDGTDVTLSLPGTGGPSTPATVPVAVGSLCGLQEDSTSFPAGWTVTYRVDGGDPMTNVAVFSVESTAEITVTVVNDPTGVPPSTTTTTTVPVTTPSTTAAPETTASTSTTAAAAAGGGGGGGASAAHGTLPTTGTGTTGTGLIAASILLMGIALLLLSHRAGDDPADAEPPSA